LKTQIQVLNHWGESLKDRVNGESFTGQSELVVKPVEQGQAVSFRLIADVVGEAGKRIDCHEMSAYVSGQKPRGHGKILVGRLGRDVVSRTKQTTYRLR
jgi:hypothetical protein